MKVISAEDVHAALSYPGLVDSRGHERWWYRVMCRMRPRVPWYRESGTLRLMHREMINECPRLPIVFVLGNYRCRQQEK